ncbi:HIT domain-containing protein [Leucothrix pacifica]|uniref:HIT family protein n=1 Tax=Leucothrix pacifica TaxID=1247513 RepID=A0A317CPI5_9GAMM|nr:HIT domain-containing protein [Leucothrix pacifica]PWR00417.1 HIT family protein [Leucothrix pacifica]
MSQIFANDHIYIKIHDSEVPWLKVYSQQSCKEFTECDSTTRQQIWQLLELIEREMLSYYKPEKINIASFGNYKPQVHWHVMARFKEDSFYPEPMWGPKQREANLDLPSMDGFLKIVLPKIEQILK